MTIRILYFASLRERMGRAEESLASLDGVDTVSDLMTFLHDRDPAGATAFARRDLVRAAVNQEFAPLNTPIQDGDEIAFFPPVTGG